MKPPTFEREGSLYRYLWAEENICVEVDQVRQRHDQIASEVTVSHIAAQNGANHILWTSLNLASTQTRDRLAKDLTKKTGLEGWSQMMEYICTRTGREYRRGEPVINLSSVTEQSEVEYLIERLMPKGLASAIFADGNSCKSWLALAICISAMTGTPLPAGLQPTTFARALYLDWETSWQETRRRLGWLARGMGLDYVPDVLYREMVGPLADDISQVRRQMLAHKVGLVVIDSIALATGGEPKETEPVLRMMGALRTLRPASVLMIGHVSKETAKSKEGGGKIYGNVFYGNLGRSLWEIRSARDGDAHCIALTHSKVNQGRAWPQFGLRFEFDDRNHQVVIRGQDLEDIPELADTQPKAARIIALLKHGAQYKDQIAETLGISASATQKELNRMAQRKQVIRLGDSGGRGKKTLWGLPADA